MSIEIVGTDYNELKDCINKPDEHFYRVYVKPEVLNFTEKFENEIEDVSFEGGRLIGIFDFDADGITSALEAKFMWPEIEVHIPDRYEDGYGIPENLDFLRQGDVVLLGDIGSNDIEGINKIRNITGKLPFIVDHHELPIKDTVPDEVYNLMQTYPKMLNFYRNPGEHIPGYCTAGLFYQIAKAKYEAEEIDKDTFSVCSMLNAFGSIADETLMNSKWDTTRKDVLEGFAAIENVSLENIAPAFGYFLSRTGLYDEAYMHTSAAQFKVNPVLNAPGRLGTIKNWHVPGGQFLFDTLSAKNVPFEKIKSRVDECIEINNRRKELEAEAVADMRYTSAVQHTLMTGKKLAIVYMPDLNPGICGRIAQKLVEETGVPSIAMCGSKNDLRGSARNAPGYPDMLEMCGKILIGNGLACGGHADAFGFVGTYDSMVKATNGLYYAYRNINPKTDLTIRAITDMKDLSVKKLLALEPHGRDYPMPCVAVTDTVTTVKDYAKDYGEIRLKSNKEIKFFGQKLNVMKNDVVQIIGNADISTFMNKTKVQINVKTLELAEKEKKTDKEYDDFEIEK